jgi:hypothetical protein
MAEKRVTSKRTFRGGHRADHPGMYDWNLYLPGGVWVRSRDGISRNPKTVRIDEDDVIYSDEEEGGNARRKCRRPNCVCVANHSGRCCIHPGRHWRSKRSGKDEKVSPERKRKKRKAEDGEEENEDGEYFSWEEVVDKQRGDRRERWLKRQGLWTGDDNGNGGGEEEQDGINEGYPTEAESSEGYATSLGFTPSREDDGYSGDEEEQARPEEEEHIQNL